MGLGEVLRQNCLVKHACGICQTVDLVFGGVEYDALPFWEVQSWETGPIRQCE